MTYQLSYPLGAAEWGWDQYESLAVSAAQAATGTYLVSLVGRDGAFTRVTAHPTREAMLAAWDAVRTSFPADVGFGIAYDKSVTPDFRVVEQGSNPLIDVWRVTQVKKQIAWRSLVPWGVAGLAVIAAAAYLKKPTTSRAGRTMKIRRRPLWRNRVVTVWR